MRDKKNRCEKRMHHFFILATRIGPANPQSRTLNWIEKCEIFFNLLFVWFTSGTNAFILIGRGIHYSTMENWLVPSKPLFELSEYYGRKRIISLVEINMWLSIKKSDKIPIGAPFEWYMFIKIHEWYAATSEQNLMNHFPWTLAMKIYFILFFRWIYFCGSSLFTTISFRNEPHALIAQLHIICIYSLHSHWLDYIT